MTNNGYVITGPPGSGKTVVLRELITLGYVGVAEPARGVIAEQRAINGEGVYDRDPALFVELMLAKSLIDFAAFVSSELPVFFDRAIPDLVGYCRIFGIDPTRAWEAAARHRYNVVIFALPPWPEIYTTDEDRKMTFESAAAFGQTIVEVYEELGYVAVDVSRSSPSGRAAFIRERVANQPRS